MPEDLDVTKFFDEHEPDQSGATELAIIHKSLFDAYLEQGFTRKEAVKLVVSYITVTGLAPDGPDD